MDNKDNLNEHDHDQEEIIIEIEMDDGTKVECEVLGNFEVEDKEYMILLPHDEDEVLLFRYEEDEENEEFELTPIEDEKEFEIVSKAYYELFDGEYDEDSEE